MKYLAASDLHLIPSRSDVWNYTLVEAYSMGTRVVSSNSTGSAIEVLYDQNNFMFSSNDFNDMIDKINRGLEYKRKKAVSGVSLPTLRKQHLRYIKGGFVYCTNPPLTLLTNRALQYKQQRL
jgi:glycosyltransferase involved in cell wall biosynthesis